MLRACWLRAPSLETRIAGASSGGKSACRSRRAPSPFRCGQSLTTPLGLRGRQQIADAEAWL